jgi:UTP:GlnB (protein PII) uridylyltransferase
MLRDRVPTKKKTNNTKKRAKLPRAGSAASYTNVLLEDIRSQVRAMAEALTLTATKKDLENLRNDLTARIEVLETAVRQNSEDIRENSEDIRMLAEELRRLSAIVAGKADRAALEAVEARVTTLERRAAG